MCISITLLKPIRWARDMNRQFSVVSPKGKAYEITCPTSQQFYCTSHTAGMATTRDLRRKVHTFVAKSPWPKEGISRSKIDTRVWESSFQGPFWNCIYLSSSQGRSHKWEKADQDTVSTEPPSLSGIPGPGSEDSPCKSSVHTEIVHVRNWTLTWVSCVGLHPFMSQHFL